MKRSREMNRHDQFHEFEKLFWQVSLEMENAWKSIYAKTFPSSQSRIMNMLDQDGPQKMSAIANALHITAGAVTTASTILIEKGYITRLRNDNDRRVIHLSLTKQGKETLADLQKEGRKMMEFVFKDSSDNELEKMNKIFKRASTNLEQLWVINERSDNDIE